MSSSPYIYDVFKGCVCPGEPHKGKHETIHGDNAWSSAFYPTEMSDSVHHAIAKRLNPKYRRAWIGRNLTKTKHEKEFVAKIASGTEKTGLEPVEDAAVNGKASRVGSVACPAPEPIVYANSPNTGRPPIGYFKSLEDSCWQPVFGLCDWTTQWYGRPHAFSGLYQAFAYDTEF